MNIAVCDDSQKDASYIETIMLECGKNTVSCDYFESGDELLCYLKGGLTHYDLFFLDIEMPGRNGIDTAQEIRKMDDKVLIIYVTNHEDYVYDVFETLPFRFLRKPVQREKLEKVWADVLDDFHSRKEIFSFIQSRMPYQVYTDQIEYFESRGRVITLHLNDHQDYTFYGRIYKIQGELNMNLFLRPHSSFLVNADYISTMSNTEILLQNGTTIPITTKYRKLFKEDYFDYIKWRRMR